MDVSVVVVSHNSAHVVGPLLDSLPAALEGLTADVIVVDNASTDGTRSLVAGRGDCRLVESENIGYAGAINVGVEAAADADALLILNPDVRLARGAVRRLREALNRPRVGIAAPRVLDDDGGLHYSLRREPSLFRAMGLNRTALPAFSEYFGKEEDYLTARKVDWALGAVLLVSRECFDAVGGWDASYFLYSEETDFCLKARDLGYSTLYEPSATAHHIGAQSGQSPTIHTMQILNRVRLYRRRHGLPSAATYYVLTVLSELTWAFRGGGASSRAAVLALLVPRRRPAVLGCSETLIPR